MQDRPARDATPSGRPPGRGRVYFKGNAVLEITLGQLLIASLKGVGIVVTVVGIATTLLGIALDHLR